LIDWPPLRKDNAKNHTDCSRSHNWAKSFIIINLSLLRGTISDQVGLITFKGTICPIFDAINPMGSNNIGMRTWDQLPSIILEQGKELI